MGAKTEYMCEKCGFIIIDHDLKYFVDEETNCVVEHASGRLTFDMGYDSEIKGRVIPSFCPNCSSEVHFCYTENECHVKEINSALEQDENEFKEILNEKYMYRINGSELMGVIESKDKIYGECPKCGKDIPLVLGDECECPKCGGRLHAHMTILYD